MIRLIRVELLKFRTTRLTYGLLATAAALTEVFAVIEAATALLAGLAVVFCAVAARTTVVRDVT
jgi:hypothetical protein